MKATKQVGPKDGYFGAAENGQVSHSLVPLSEACHLGLTGSATQVIQHSSQYYVFNTDLFIQSSYSRNDNS